MKQITITLRLFASLRDTNKKEQLITVPGGSTPQDVMVHLNIPQEKVTIIMVNGIHSKNDVVLKDDDVLSLFPAIGGG